EVFLERQECLERGRLARGQESEPAAPLVQGLDAGTLRREVRLEREQPREEGLVLRRAALRQRGQLCERRRASQAAVSVGSHTACRERGGEDREERASGDARHALILPRRRAAERGDLRGRGARARRLLARESLRK